MHHTQWSPERLVEHFREHEPKGEFVIVVAGQPKEETKVKRNRYRQDEEAEE